MKDIGLKDILKSVIITRYDETLHKLKTSLFSPHIFIILLLAVLSSFSWTVWNHRQEKDIVNIYDWFGVLSPDILHQFEQETGIRVQLDVYDHNEVLETKLLAGRSGYDLVFPTAFPYVPRQIEMGVYQKIDFSLLDQWKNINPWVMKHMQIVCPQEGYALPYYWGTIGFVYDEEVLPKIIPDIKDLDSWALLFDPAIVSRLSQKGVSLLGEPVDIFPIAALFLGLDSKQYTQDDVFNRLVEHIKGIRPSIRRFAAGRFINDILMGDICIAQAWSGEASKLVREAQSIGRKLRYVIPKEGTLLWIDCMAIPYDAPHPRNAHKFINFLLRPDISASITNRTMLATVKEDARPLLDPDIRNHPTMFPTKEQFSKLISIPVLSGKKREVFERKLVQVWREIKLSQIS